MSHNENLKNQPTPGEGLRSLKTTGVFRAINFELYVKPNLAIMGIGLVAFTGCLGYIAYMRQKYESMGYYSAIGDNGKEEFVKKKSKWD
ncbi:small integral membrane protein 8 [Coccinella septempunctata]|uniref:small integral membrane protein 8 n=1 Tax=Coccinella septempunctata TaxID=41139 RepID=UPI001D090A2F|nr:small integral membrane protein 8 [Coccinella septempunctata]